DSRGQWDARRLKQLLRNLVCNAIDHGGAGTPVRVALVAEDASVRLEVTNEGSTLDAGDVSELFPPLRRGLVRASSREDREGLGLGLFIVREIAQAHGGKVDFVYAPAQGETTFAVSLPR